MKEFTELKAGDQARVMEQIQIQRKAGTLYEAKKSGAVNCKAVATFKTTDKNGVKIGKGDMATFWYDKASGIARLYAITHSKAAAKPVKAAKKAKKAAAKPEATVTMTKAQFEAALKRGVAAAMAAILK
jgi:septal ring-binding cell division protein DamX